MKLSDEDEDLIRTGGSYRARFGGQSRKITLYLWEGSNPNKYAKSRKDSPPKGIAA